MKPSIDSLEQAAVAQQCRALRLPAVADQCASLAEEAIKQRLTYLRYLEALLAAELEERERNTIARRIKDAHLPRMKTLDEFDFSKAPQIQATKIHELAQGGYIERAEPIILIGDCGTGKTHLLTGLCVAACRQKRRVRFATAAALVNELVEASDDRTLSKVIGRYGRIDLLCLDELGYIELDRRGAELLFQVFTEREEKASVAIASNAPFSEWTSTFADPRLCAAIVDRLTYDAHIITTGTGSYRLRTTAARRQAGGT